MFMFKPFLAFSWVLIDLMHTVQYTTTDLVQSIRCLNSLTSRLCIVQDPQACTKLCSYFFHTAREHKLSWSLAKFCYEYGNLSKADQCADSGLAVQHCIVP